MTVLDDDDASVFWQCERIQMLDADTLSVLIISQKPSHSDTTLHIYILFWNLMGWQAFSYFPLLRHWHIYIYRDGVLLKNYRPIVSLWISVVHLTLHQSHWNYHFIFFWDSLSVQRFFTLFHFLFSALATINGIDGVSRISPIEWKGNLD